MAVTATPVFPQSIKNGAVNITSNDTTTLKTLYTGGTNGSIINHIIVSSTDTSARDLVFYLTVPQDIAASGTLTSTGTNPSNGDTVTIGSKTYTFQTTLTNVDGNVKIGATAALSMTNLFNAINVISGSGTPGTDFAAATTAHTTVTATNPTSTTVFIRAISTGTGGNSIATTETSSQLSFGSSTLTGGSVATNVDYLLATVSIPANSGNTNAISLATILDNTRFGTQQMDSHGNKVYCLQYGNMLKVKAGATITAAKYIYVTAQVSDL